MMRNGLRFYMAGLIAFLIGMPLTEKAFGQTSSIISSAIDLGLSIANSSSGDS